MASAPTDHTSSSVYPGTNEPPRYPAQQSTHEQGNSGVTWNETPHRPKPVSTTALLLSLTAKDYSWRSKVLKIVQYLIKLHVWRLKFINKGDHTERWSGAARNLSVTRALFTVGSSIDTVDKFLKGLSSLSEKDDVLTDSKTALQLTADGIDAISEVIDDVNALKKSQVLEQKNLPGWFPRAVEVTWALTCVIRLTEAVGKMNKARRKLQKTQEDYHQRIYQNDQTGKLNTGSQPEDPYHLADYRHSITYAAHQLHMHKQAYVSAWLNVAKCALDCGQSVPPALYLSDFVPDSVDIGCGLLSGVVGVAKTVLDNH